MSTDAFEQLIDVAAPGGGSYPVQRGHRRGVRSPHTFDAARWPPSSLTSPYAPQGSTTAVLGRLRGRRVRSAPDLLVLRQCFAASAVPLLGRGVHEVVQPDEPQLAERAFLRLLPLRPDKRPPLRQRRLQRRCQRPRVRVHYHLSGSTSAVDVDLCHLLPQTAFDSCTGGDESVGEVSRLVTDDVGQAF